MDDVLPDLLLVEVLLDLGLIPSALGRSLAPIIKLQTTDQDQGRK
jgi:hypothetical protein